MSITLKSHARSCSRAMQALRPGACAVILGAYISVAGAASSEPSSQRYATGRETLGEVILAPMPSATGWSHSDGWILIYRNIPTGPAAPDVELQTRTVVRTDIRGQTAKIVISWEIVRTPNNTCREAGAGLCPDRLRVVSVSDGYQAIPEATWAEEGSITSIRVVPALMG